MIKYKLFLDADAEEPLAVVCDLSDLNVLIRLVNALGVCEVVMETPSNAWYIYDALIVEDVADQILAGVRRLIDDYDIWIADMRLDLDRLLTQRRKLHDMMGTL